MFGLKKRDLDRLHSRSEFSPDIHDLDERIYVAVPSVPKTKAWAASRVRPRRGSRRLGFPR